MRVSFALVVAIAACAACVTQPKTEAQIEAERLEAMQKRYNAEAREECRQTPDIDERRACIDRVNHNSVMRGVLPLRS